MKKINILIVFFFLYLSANAQDVIAERTSDLMPEDYSIQGDGILQEYDNGLLTFSLSDDFSTPFGPDVRILLSNSLSASGAFEVVNLSTISHFSGAYSIDLPSDVGIEDYQFILFYCVNFQQFWASGEFGETVVIGTTFECAENATELSDGSNIVDVCPGDGVVDLVTLSNSIAGAGVNYAYLLTDENEILQEVILNGSYNFEGSTSDVQRVYGIHYDGTLNPMIGENRLETTATNCFVHSDGDFITVTKNACSGPFECVESLTATTDWVTSVDVCVTDGQPDAVLIKNNISTPAGENYVFLFTDVNEILLEVVIDSIYDFEGTNTEELRVYGMSYSGNITPAIGEVRQNTTASECFVHSGDDIFLTINKTAACNSTSVLDATISEQISIYPIPTSEVLNIKLPKEFEAKELSLYNILGMEVLRSDVESSDLVRLDLNSLSVGNYVLRINDGKDWFVKNISIVR